MRKIVVVVGGGKIVTFEGEDLEAIDHNITEGKTGKLVIVENAVVVPTSGADSYTKKKTVAVFRSWRYWKNADEGTNDVVGYYETDVSVNVNGKVMIPVTDKTMKNYPDLLGSTKFCPLARYKSEKQ